MSLPSQSLLSWQGAAALVGGVVLLQLAAVERAQSAKGRPRIHIERAFVAGIQRRFESIVITRSLV
jgi:hypothetical protein